ncbi:Autotransporter adhesin EhaG [Cupriavidus campinensis]|jgi:autotransporter adhesin|uniref:Trimeric autotransporter adhesin YadA-like head domain-containing protein n=1 Tax=Cupriavidus campinensis TaxID=151783 RepID=A0ABY3ESL8_9BURK|nr:hypothetical protein [Cupriavidus campinensis]TSP13781.1 hypothetical protein FGG12_04675 [Cupriavidus campinensis]CAG2141922.1 Autotransporter adhesin EhaG [Cupriavidus campinensis]
MANSQTAVSDKEDIPASLEARKAFQPDLYVTRQQFLALKQRVDALTLEDKDKGAKYFRANSTGPDSQATGQEAVAIGPSAIAGGAGSVAIGEGVSYPTSGRGVVIGSLAYVGTGEPNDGVVVLGCDANASGERAVAIGGGASATFTDNVAIGGGAIAYFSGASVAVGGAAYTAGEQCVAVGYGARAEGSWGVALGGGAQVTGDASVGIGQSLRVTNRWATVVGSGAKVEFDGGVAIGAYAVCDREDSVSVGNVAMGRYIAHVLPGRHDDEVVTVGQLKDAGLLVNADGGLENTVVAFSDTGRGKVALPSTQVSGLRQGEVSARSTDAVTGSQLFRVIRRQDDLEARIAALERGARRA